MRAVQEERDVAVATLSRHGLVEEYQSVCQQEGVAQDHVTEAKDRAIEQLRQQNKELHAVIRQMRQEMEQLTGFSEQRDNEPHHQTSDNGEALTMGYVKYMVRAGQVPSSKVRQKLLQATQAIVALVREKEALGEERRWLREEVGRLQRLQVGGERRRGDGTEVLQRSAESSQCGARGLSPSPQEEEADSLHSLKFSDSSDLEEVFEMVDPLSSTLQSEHQDMPSLPALFPNQHPPKQDPPPQPLELRGSRVTAHQRVAGARKHQQAKTRKTEPHKPKLKIRNYNNKEN